MAERGISRIRIGWRFIASLVMALYLIGTVPIAVLAGLLLVHAATGPGRLFAGAVLLALPLPVVLWGATYLKRSRGAVKVAAAVAVLVLLLLAIDYGLTPDGRPLAGAPVRSCFSGTAVYRRASMANLVPEIDQLLLATYVVPALDPLMDRANTQEVREQVRMVYGEMRRAPEFECLGSVLNLTYRDLFLNDRAVGHFYEYIPPSATPERLPVVLFLHGSLGNFRGYLWVWKSLADHYGFAVVAPSFGAGNWDEPGGEAVIEQARRYCASHPRMDPSRIYLAGLSNGGRGACLGARRAPDAYRGLIFLSPVLDTDTLMTPSFVAAWKDKPILILHGTADNRIPVPYVSAAAAALSQAGLQVESQFYDGQTHFLFFSSRAQVGERLGTWLTSHR